MTTMQQYAPKIQLQSQQLQKQHVYFPERALPAIEI